jgi:hypothetical protein
MIECSFFLFGLDLFRLGRRTPYQTEQKSSERKDHETARSEQETAYPMEREYSERFFWGMYPVY